MVLHTFDGHEFSGKNILRLKHLREGSLTLLTSQSVGYKGNKNRKVLLCIEFIGRSFKYNTKYGPNSANYNLAFS